MVVLLVVGGGNVRRDDEADMRLLRSRDKLDNSKWPVQYSEQ
jgi:hypothetical protein